MGSTEAYKEAWGTYYYLGWSTTKDFNFVEYDSTPTAIEDITTSHPAIEAIYNLQGQKLSAPHRGINIINGKKVIIK